jgi:fumarate hydratase class II
MDDPDSPTSGSPEHSGEESSDAEESITRKLRCDAIRTLTPDIIPVLSINEGEIISKVYAEGLIGEDEYKKGITQATTNTTRQLLLAVVSQIRSKNGCFDTFLRILRSSAITEAIADRIEEKVEKLQHQQSKHRKVKKSKKMGRQHKSNPLGMPNLDSFEGYSSGVQSDLSESQVGDALSVAKSISNGAEAMSDASNFQGEGNEYDSTVFITPSHGNLMVAACNLSN